MVSLDNPEVSPRKRNPGEENEFDFIYFFIHVLWYIVVEFKIELLIESAAFLQRGSFPGAVGPLS